jgi:hypothetical protein
MDRHSSINPNADPALTVFQQAMFGEDGKDVLFFWQAKTVENNLIPAFGSRTAYYQFILPAILSGEITLEVALRLRALPPYFLRELGLGELVAKVPIVDMAKTVSRITVN